jgi:peptide/nickel transport system substrate-binding protein
MVEPNYWTRLLDRRVSRRAALRAGATSAAGIGAATFLASCGSSNNKKANTSAAPANSSNASSNAAAPAASAAASATPTLSAPPTGKTGGTYNVGFTGPFAGVDPHNSVYGGSGIVPVVYSLLVRANIYAPQFGIIPDLVQSYELMPDKVTTVFKLRPDAMIAQNSQNVPVRAMNAQDVVKSFDRIADKTLGTNGFQFFNDHVDKYTAVDNQTVQLVTKAPYAWTLNILGNNLVGAIVPVEWLSSPDIKKTAVGSGFMTLTELVEGSHATLVKNPNYFNKGRPYLDSEVIKTFADQSTYRTAFSSGQVDVYGATNIDEAKQLQKDGKNVQLLNQAGTTNYQYSVWMNTKIKPWDDGRVRQAIMRAINPDEYIQLIGHGQGQWSGLITPSMKPYDLPQDQIKSKYQPFSIKDAKDLLTAAGQSNLTFDFAYPTSSNMPDYVNIFVRQMAAAGITAKGQPQDAGTWVAQYFASKLSFSTTLNQEYQDPNSALLWYHTNGITGNGHYDTGFSDPSVDKAIDDAATNLDEQARVKAYQDAQTLIYSKNPAFFYLSQPPSNIVYQNYIQNYPAHEYELGYWYLQDLWLNKA